MMCVRGAYVYRSNSFFLSLPNWTSHQPTRTIALLRKMQASFNIYDDMDINVGFQSWVAISQSCVSLTHGSLPRQVTSLFLCSPSTYRRIFEKRGFSKEIISKGGLEYNMIRGLHLKDTVLGTRYSVPHSSSTMMLKSAVADFAPHTFLFATLRYVLS
jgi:hypothetical protein